MPILGTLPVSGTFQYTGTWVPEFIVVGSVDTDNPVSQLNVTISGKAYQILTAQTRITTIAKYLLKSILGTDIKIGSVFKIADGFIPNTTFQLSMVNAVATAYTVYQFSTGKGSKAYTTGEVTIQASSMEQFTQFSMICFDPTNMNYADITFEDGHTDPFTAVELRTLFALANPSDTDANLGTLVCIDNRLRNILEVKLYTSSGGSITVGTAVL